MLFQPLGFDYRSCCGRRQLLQVQCAISIGWGSAFGSFNNIFMKKKCYVAFKFAVSLPSIIIYIYRQVLRNCLILTEIFRQMISSQCHLTFYMSQIWYRQKKTKNVKRFWKRKLWYKTQKRTI